jgi:uncharacterized protein
MRLFDLLRSLGRAAVAFSGGIDSTVVACAAYQVLGENAVALTADSPSVPRAEIAGARALAEYIGIRHIIVPTDEFADPDYVKNDGARCYFCKSELYTRIEKLLPELGLSVICSGANLDDQGDYRPGLKAAAEHGIRHPLLEAGLTKADVRARTSVPVGSRPQRFTCGCWDFANCACGCTRANWPGSKCRRANWRAWPSRVCAINWWPI